MYALSNIKFSCEIAGQSTTKERLIRYLFNCLLSCTIEHVLCLKHSSLNISLYVSNNQLKPVLTYFFELGTFLDSCGKRDIIYFVDQ